MSIRFRCENPACARKMKAPSSAAGKRAKCPSCGQKQTIPVPIETDTPAKAAKPLKTYDLADSAEQSRMSVAAPAPASSRASRPAAVAAAPARAKAEEIMCPVCGNNYVKGTFCPVCRARREAAHKKASPWGKVIGGVVAVLVILAIGAAVYFVIGK